MNKYQEALKGIKDYCLWWCRCIDKDSLLDKDFNTLQELIDKQSEYIYQMDKYEMQHEEMFEKMVKLDKALDKACEKLFFARVFEGMTPRKIKEYLFCRK